MTGSEGKSRAYDGRSRARQARETRRRIVEAAARRFEREGYAATSVAASAAEAGVAEPTVYATLRSKANVLRAVIDLTVRGDDAAAPLAERAGWRAMARIGDPRERLAAFARLHRGICEREAAVFAQLEAAAGADAEATAMLAEHDRRRYATQTRVARGLRRRGELDPGLSVRAAADVVWTLASERTYLALVRDRGWEPEGYERWLAQQLVAALLPPGRRISGPAGSC